jgi:hypothetical protein
MADLPLTDAELSALAWKFRGWTDDDNGPVLYPRAVSLAVIAKVTADKLKGCTCYQRHYGFIWSASCPACKTGRERMAFRAIIREYLTPEECEAARYLVDLRNALNLPRPNLSEFGIPA